jgi:peptidyl-prolyl cis-trans isomerase SDCCAG10
VDERPEFPHKILKCSVLNNPFPDIEPRQLIERIKDDKAEKQKSKMKATKDFNLLSFGDEAEEEEEDLVEASKQFSAGKGKSAHDLLNDPKLSAEVGVEAKETEKGDSSSEEEEGDNKPAGKVESGTIDINSLREKLKSGKSKAPKRSAVVDKGHSEDEDDENASAEKKKREEIQKEIRALKREMKRSKEDGQQESESSDNNGKREITEEEKNNDMLKAYHDEKEKYFSQKKPVPKKGSAREEATMKLLEKFKSKLHSVMETGEELQARSGGDNEEDVEDDRWMAHTLKFQSDDPVLAKDASTKDDEWFDIYDPRNPVNKRRRGEKASKSSRK